MAPAPGYRVRDFTPDARGTQFSTVGGTAHEQADISDANASPVVERTLTRRELRELREAAEAAAPPAPAPHAPTQHNAPAQQARFDPARFDPARFDPAPPELVEPLEPRTNASQPVQAPSAAQSHFAADYTQRASSWSAPEPEPAPDVVMVAHGAFAPPVPEFDLSPDFAPSAARVAPGAPSSLDDSALQHAGYARPEGHWSRQADIDDRTQRTDVLPSRDLSRIDAITTSALVLPSMPQNPIGALSSTGEILVTGSIDLPRMLGATGIHPARYDHSEFDSMIEAGDREDSHPNSAPVRAIRAVSTHTSTQGIMAAKRPRSKIPTVVLAGFATVMGVGVVVLFVVGMLLNLF